MKGLFIDICGFYWINDCNTTLAILKKKFSNAISLLDELVNLDIIKHENKHDKVEIDFLNKQYDLLSEKRKLRQNAGSKGGNAKAMLKQKRSYKDKDKDNNKDKEKDNNIPEFLDFKNYAFIHKPNVCETDLKFKYDSWIANDWKNGNDKKIKNWKSTLLNTLPYIKDGLNSNADKPLKMVY